MHIQIELYGCFFWIISNLLTKTKNKEKKLKTIEKR